MSIDTPRRTSYGVKPENPAESPANVTKRPPILLLLVPAAVRALHKAFELEEA